MESEAAAGRLKQIFGSDRYSDSGETIQYYSSSLNGPVVSPMGVVFPVNTTEVVQLFQVASKYGLKLFPISRGKNFGYGEAQGTSAGQLIVDLSRMNSIVEVNEELACCTIQPGVTQQQLFNHLSSSQSRLQLDVTGGGLHASIMGNVLERGFGHTDYGDRFNRIINLTIVIPDGSIIKTGFRDQENSNASSVYRFGSGPVIDGLFSQSNFGIVTEMTLELMPVPEKMCMFIVTTKDANAIGSLVNAIRELKLSGVVSSAVHFANKARATGSDSTKLAGEWNLSGSISGPARLVRARRTVVRRMLKKFCPSATIWFIDDFMMQMAEFVYKNLFKFSLYPALKDAYDLQKGIPTDHPLQVLLNDKQLNSADLNTGNYQTCFSWINAVCAADDKSVNVLLGLTRGQFESAGYEFRITFTAVNPRSLIMISNITYPRKTESIESAKKFIAECYAVLIQNGFLPYRSGSGMYDKIPPRSPELQKLLSKFKSAIDPNGIIAPGKYNLD
jgi:4-cresol dehydrogenase (hydroxylating) flavoprotein subunit